MKKQDPSGRPTDLKSAEAESKKAAAATAKAIKADRPGEKWMDKPLRGFPGAHHENAAEAHVRASIAASEAGNKALAKYHDKMTDLHDAASRGDSRAVKRLAGQHDASVGKPTKASKLAAFAAEGKKKSAAEQGPVMRGKKGGAYRTSKSGRKVYLKR